MFYKLAILSIHTKGELIYFKTEQAHYVKGTFKEPDIHLSCFVAKVKELPLEKAFYSIQEYFNIFILGFDNSFILIAV